MSLCPHCRKNSETVYCRECGQATQPGWEPGFPKAEDLHGRGMAILTAIGLADQAERMVTLHIDDRSMGGSHILEVQLAGWKSACHVLQEVRKVSRCPNERPILLDWPETRAAVRDPRWKEVPACVAEMADATPRYGSLPRRLSTEKGTERELAVLYGCPTTREMTLTELDRHSEEIVYE